MEDPNVEVTPPVVEKPALNVVLQHAASSLIEAQSALGALLNDNPPSTGTLPNGALDLGDVILALAADVVRGVAIVQKSIGQL